MTSASSLQRLLPTSAHTLVERFQSIRAQTEALCAPLEIEDYVVQPAPFVSPPKWHLAHTTWFFDCFLLQPAGRRPASTLQESGLLFNSYYKSQGRHWAQHARGQLSRPTVREVLAWRRAVTGTLGDLLERDALNPNQLQLVEMGLHHEQQHQELLLMDIKYIFGMQPYPPAYLQQAPLRLVDGKSMAWLDIPEGFCEAGAPDSDFSFDNERPRHRRWLNGYRIADRLVTNADFLEFVQDDGYRRPALWLSDGWDWVQRESIQHPLYWRFEDEHWQEYQLTGLAPLRKELPVSHVSYYEADAFARWSGARLPDEFELENFLARHGDVDPARLGWLTQAELHPGLSGDSFGNGLAWQWTSSAYAPYPGFTPEPGAVGEYNGKFMCNQYVLKGGCFTTPRGHLRHSYRNFYRAHDRWAVTGIRLASEAA